MQDTLLYEEDVAGEMRRLGLALLKILRMPGSLPRGIEIPNEVRFAKIRLRRPVEVPFLVATSFSGFYAVFGAGIAVTEIRFPYQVFYRFRGQELDISSFPRDMFVLGPCPRCVVSTLTSLFHEPLRKAILEGHYDGPGWVQDFVSMASMVERYDLDRVVVFRPPEYAMVFYTNLTGPYRLKGIYTHKSGSVDVVRVRTTLEYGTDRRDEMLPVMARIKRSLGEVKRLSDWYTRSFSLAAATLKACLDTGVFG